MLPKVYLFYLSAQWLSQYFQTKTEFPERQVKNLRQKEEMFVSLPKVNMWHFKQFLRSRHESREWP